MIESAFGSMADAALRVYPAATDTEALQSMRNIFCDTAFTWLSWTWAKLQKATGKSRVYSYYFDQPQPPMLTGTPLDTATHTDEINYVFGNMKNNYNYQYTAEDKALSDLLLNYWVNFDATGNPNADSLPK